MERGVKKYLMTELICHFAPYDTKFLISIFAQLEIYLIITVAGNLFDLFANNIVPVLINQIYSLGAECRLIEKFFYKR